MAVGRREAQVRAFVDEVWNRRNYEAAADLYSDTYANGFGTGPSARIEPIRRYHGAFPDLHLDIEELIVAGDAVVLRCTFRGTDTGGYLDRPPTGRAVEEWSSPSCTSRTTRSSGNGSAPTSSDCSFSWVL